VVSDDAGFASGAFGSPAGVVVVRIAARALVATEPRVLTGAGDQATAVLVPCDLP
jgi:hypothetical protein